MAENDSDKKQPWLVPIVVAVLGLISAMAVALISKPPSSQESTSKSEAYTLQAVNPEGVEIHVSKGQTLTIEAKGEVYTNLGGPIQGCDNIPARPDGLGKCRYSSELDIPFMALIGEFNNGLKFFIGLKITRTFVTNGTLLLKVNDWNNKDNTGNFEILVTRK